MQVGGRYVAPERADRGAPTQEVRQYSRSTMVGPSGRRPPARGAATRRLLALMFWSVLLGSLALWWFDTPNGSVEGRGSALIEGARITGLIGGYCLIVQVLLMSRVGWLDQRLSANDLLRLHRDLGFALTVMLSAHAAFSIVGYATEDQISPLAETRNMIATFEDMTSAIIATGLLLAIALVSMRAVRAVLNYEIWYYIHLTSYAALLLSYGHAFADGRDLGEGYLGRYVWIAMYVFVVACLFWGRIVAPIRLNLRHRLRVLGVQPEGPDIFSIYIHGRRLDEMRARAGQFFRWRFLARGLWTQAHPFSLSAAPNGQWLRLTIKAVGEHTEQLRWLEPGTRVIAEGPSGVFTAERRRRHRALLIAGGSGIAPIRALLEDLPRGTIVIYRARSPEELIFREEFDYLAEQRDAEIIYVLGARTDPGPRRLMTPKGIRRLVPDVTRRDVYMCGPEGLVNAATEILNRLRVPRKQIHLDPFEF